jgi:hypothetical protein
MRREPTTVQTDTPGNLLNDAGVKLEQRGHHEPWDAQ